MSSPQDSRLIGLIRGMGRLPDNASLENELYAPVGKEIGWRPREDVGKLGFEGSEVGVVLPLHCERIVGEPQRRKVKLRAGASAFRNRFFLGFRQWRSRADRVLTLNMNIRLTLFWCTWSRTSPARGPDSATCAALRIGVIIGIVEPRSKSHKRCLVIVFP